MKECLACAKCYDDSLTHCPKDGKLLEFTLKGGLLLDDKYIFNCRLGEGGMGTVYQATQMVLQRSVAIKVLSPSFTSNTNARERFEREALAIAKLKHPNIVSIYDFGFSRDGYAYLVMEFIQGFQLKRIMERWPICGLEFGLDIARQISEALSIAHAFGVLHRDIKPENIMFEALLGNSILKVVDFGLVKIRGEEGQQRRLTSPNMLVGTFNYMSPEVCLGEDADERSDIYSFGILLYQLFTGTLPCYGDDPLEIIEAHIKRAVTAPSNFINDIPKRLEELILSCLDKNPVNRPQSAQQLAKEFSQILIEISKRNINSYTPTTAKAELLIAQQKISGDVIPHTNVYELERAQTALLKDPYDISQQEKIAEINQKTGLVLEAIEAFFNLAGLYYQVGKLTLSANTYWKIYFLVNTQQRIFIIKRLIDIYFQKGEFSLAYKHCNWLIRHYLAKELYQLAQEIVEEIPVGESILQDYKIEFSNLIKDEASGKLLTGSNWRRRRPQTKTDLSSQVIFIVSQDIETRNQLAQASNKLGCQVMSGDSAKEVLFWLETQWPTIIIFDTELIDITGSELYWQLITMPAMQETTYVCISSNKKDVEIDAAFNEGVDEYWVKPIEIDGLTTNIKRLLLHNKYHTQPNYNLYTTSILEILQELEKSRRTGILTIKSDIEQAMIFLRDGIIVNAKLNKLPPLGVLYRVTSWQEALVSFRPGPVALEQPILVTTYQLMLHILNFYDEEQIIVSNFPNTDSYLQLELPEMIIAEEREQEVVKLFDGSKSLGEVLERLRGDFMSLTIALSIYRSNNPNLVVDLGKTVVSDNPRRLKDSNSKILTRPLN